MKTKHFNPEGYFIRVFGAEWGYVLFSALLVALATMVLNGIISSQPTLLYAFIVGFLMGGFYGFDRANQDATTLAYYIGVRALFPRLVRSSLARANGGEYWGARGRADIVPIRLIITRRWKGRSGIKLLVSYEGDLKTTFVPEDIFIAYMRRHFSVEVHTVSGGPDENSYQHFYFPLELKPQVDVKAK